MNVLCVVQARFASSRLPGKAMYPLKGTTMLGFLLRRLAAIATDSLSLCLATTRNPEDDILAAWAKALDISVVRGDEHDVLHRYITCLEHFQVDGCIRVTGDNPLTSRAMVQLVQASLCQGYDYVDGFSLCPVGVGVDGFSRDLLLQLDSMDLSPAEREHINKRVLGAPGSFVLHQTEAPELLRRRDVSLTVDTLQDYNALVARLEHVDLPVESIGAAHVLA